MKSPSDFEYDVFLSHSSKDKSVVSAIAERLKKDGLRVWFDKWEIKPGDSIPARIEDGLEGSRVLVLCMSANAFGSDWASLEAGTFRFRDPLNKERRFIPLRLDEAPIKGSLAQFLYVSWLLNEREQSYAKLLEACRPSARDKARRGRPLETDDVLTCAFSQDRRYALTGGADFILRIWDVRTARCLHEFHGHTEAIWSAAWSADQQRVISGGDDGDVRIWSVESKRCVRTLVGHDGGINGLAWSADQRTIVSGGEDQTIRLWDSRNGECVSVFNTTGAVYGVSMNLDENRVLSGSRDSTIRLWDTTTGRCTRVLRGHTGELRTVVWSPDQRSALSGGEDLTVRLWDLSTGKCLRVLEGHSGFIWSLAWSTNQRYALSGSTDGTVRLWELNTGKCLRVIEDYDSTVRGVAWSSDQQHALSGDGKGKIRVSNVSEYLSEGPTNSISAEGFPLASDHVQYTNAKVLLVGESGAGKTGLSKVLAGEKWQPSDSTVGAWATQWKLPVSSADGVEREIWLWDFGGQADQRLIHQLYMDETALAALIFDGQKEDLFETLGQWDRDLTRASSKQFSKILVAGRVDAGGLRTSRSQIEAFRTERGYLSFLETSAKTGVGCKELRQAILDGIDWDEIPWRSSPLLFKRLKEEIVLLKDEGRILMRFNELRETLLLRLSGEVRFTDDQLKAVVGLLASPGVVWELNFGSWVLLQPECINAYAQAVIQTMRHDKDERGCIAEERVLNGGLMYHSSVARLAANEERFVLLAMHQTLVERGLCFREHTDLGSLLVFPSYYRRERPELVGHPAVLVSYRFNGFLDDIYATLVVRLHHTKAFRQDQLWRYAADFKTLTEKQLGVKLTRRAEGAGELEVYFDPTIPVEEKIIFSKYVHEHLLQNASDVIRLRYYVCTYCNTPVENREVAMRRLDGWLSGRSAEVGVTAPSKTRLGNASEPTIVCTECEKRVSLWDEMERCFASPEIQQQVYNLQHESTIILDSESKERALVGDVISTVALAGQICREKTVSDHGIDMEVEFKSDRGAATGKMVYLQLKSGDSYLSTRKRDGLEIFKIDKARHADYWRDQAFPVLLIIRNSDGESRWMDVREYLQRETDNGKKAVRHIVFNGQRFDVMSVRRWRDAALAK